MRVNTFAFENINSLGRSQIHLSLFTFDLLILFRVFLSLSPSLVINFECMLCCETNPLHGFIGNTRTITSIKTMKINILVNWNHTPFIQMNYFRFAYNRSVHAISSVFQLDLHNYSLK